MGKRRYGGRIPFFGFGQFAENKKLSRLHECDKCHGKIVKEIGMLPHCEDCGMIPKKYNKYAQKEIESDTHFYDDNDKTFKKGLKK